MRKIILLSSITFLLCSALLGQNINYALFKDHKTKSGFSPRLIIDSNTILLAHYKKSKNERLIVQFNENGKSKEFKIDSPSKNPRHLNYFQFNGSLTALFYEHRKKQKSADLFLIKFDSKFNEIQRLKISTFNYSHKKDLPYYRCRISQDKKKILIVNLHDNDLKNNLFKLSGFVFNENLELLNEFKNEKVSKNSQLTNEIYDLTIDNKGTVMILSKTYLDKQNEVSRTNELNIPNYTFQVIQYRINEDYVEHKLDNYDYFIYSANLIRSESKELMILLELKDAPELSAISLGFLTYVWDEKVGRFNPKMNAFSDEEYDIFKFDDKEITNFRVTAYTSNKSDIYFLFEQRTNKMESAEGGRGVKHMSIHGNTIVFKLNNKGEITKNYLIPKYHKNESKRSPTLIFKWKESFALIYKDLKNNLTKELDNHGDFRQKIFASKDRIPIFAYLDSNNKIQRQTNSKIGHYRKTDLTIDKENGQVLIPIWEIKRMKNYVNMVKINSN